MTELMAQAKDLKRISLVKRGDPREKVILKMQKNGMSECEIMKFVISANKNP